MTLKTLIIEKKKAKEKGIWERGRKGQECIKIKIKL